MTTGSARPLNAAPLSNRGGAEAEAGSSRVLDQQIDTTDATGALAVPCWARFAQLDGTACRAADGRHSKCSLRGVRFGRHKSLPQQQITELQERRRKGAIIRVLMNDYPDLKSDGLSLPGGVSPSQPEASLEFV